MTNALVIVATLLLVQDHCLDAQIHQPKRNIPELQYGHEICTLQAKTGRCKAYFRKFFFNILTQNCELFTYGGCDGNENRFETIEECEAKCKVKDKRNPCLLNFDAGPCRALFTRYFYNQVTKQCETFSYGGCLGNKNNFHTLEHCQNKCQKKKLNVPEICKPSLQKGDCKDSLKRFFYNITIDKCEMFIYTGCGGNTNNFDKKRTCNQVCRKGKKLNTVSIS
uniref:Tissue factor pathway inhibitor n=1 Tax=Callorhinchus milii TaxID=7868 RepID=V9KIA0_CALMI